MPIREDEKVVIAHHEGDLAYKVKKLKRSTCEQVKN